MLHHNHKVLRTRPDGPVLIFSFIKLLLRSWILLDNQSSISIFCNLNMVSNIRETNKTLDLTMNAGVLVTNKKADAPKWGEVWFSPDAVTNIFSLANMSDRYPVSYNGTKEDAFIMQLPHKQVKFEQLTNKLYVFKLPNTVKPTTKDDAQFVNTVEENKTFYTQHQFEQAKQARDLFHALGTPSVNDFKAII